VKLKRPLTYTPPNSGLPHGSSLNHGSSGLRR
jgi:hypothetical protein